MIDALTAVTDFDARYLQPHEIKKTERRTREWTIPRLIESGVTAGRVLSAGCGNGADIGVLRSLGYDAYGVDLYDPIPEAMPWFHLAGADAMPFESTAFDAVICLEVIEHIPHRLRQKAAKEMRRVLRRGGIIIVATPNRLFPADEHSDFLRFHSPFHDDTLSVGEIEQLFEAKARPLTWARYFAFERFGLVGKLLPVPLAIFDIPILHRSPLNPHLFLELRC